MLLQNLLKCCPKLVDDACLELFVYADELEEDEEESDTELERQNIEELYDFVRHTHQQDIQLLRKDVQHPALIPILRPYQSEAVNWMLHRENHTSTPSNGKYMDLKNLQNCGKCNCIVSSNVSLLFD